MQSARQLLESYRADTIADMQSGDCCADGSASVPQDIVCAINNSVGNSLVFIGSILRPGIAEYDGCRWFLIQSSWNLYDRFFAIQHPHGAVRTLCVLQQVA